MRNLDFFQLRRAQSLEVFQKQNLPYKKIKE